MGRIQEDLFTAVSVDSMSASIDSNMFLSHTPEVQWLATTVVIRKQLQGADDC